MFREALDSRRGWWLATAWLVVAAAAVGYGIVQIDRDLKRQTDDALAAAGLENVEVRIDGRDVVVTGDVDPSQVQGALADITGVRTIRFADSPPSTQPALPTTTLTPVTTSPPTPSTSAPTTTVPPPPRVAYLRASLEAGRVVIDGAVPDPEVAARLRGLADLIYAPLLDNRLEVDPSVETAPWVPNAATVIARLPIVGTSSIEVTGTEATLRGLAPTPERLAQLQSAVQAALGPEVTLTSEVEVTGLAPPFVHAEAPGDGSVTLTGTMPSEAVVQLIAGTAIEVFGADAVDNQLVVDPDVDTTFSLFRLPLTFVAFQPVPQWEVTIDDDLITGALRGGATFPSGSSELTPEILQLMPIAAGILARNPTLGMVIEGHTDDIGSDEFNLRLSEARAEAARVWLIEAGIEEARVLAVGYGEERPSADNGTEAGRALNRRIEFVLGPASALGESP